MEELNFTPFNHGYLCQMLRSATEKELNNIIVDVQKEKERRQNEKKNECLKKIREAIAEATDAGFVIAFYPNSFSDNAEYLIDDNSETSLDIQLE